MSDLRLRCSPEFKSSSGVGGPSLIKWLVLLLLFNSKRETEELLIPVARALLLLPPPLYDGEFLKLLFEL